MHTCGLARCFNPASPPPWPLCRGHPPSLPPASLPTSLGKEARSSELCARVGLAGASGCHIFPLPCHLAGGLASLQVVALAAVGSLLLLCPGQWLEQCCHSTHLPKTCPWVLAGFAAPQCTDWAAGPSPARTCCRPMAVRGVTCCQPVVCRCPQHLCASRHSCPCWRVALPQMSPLPSGQVSLHSLVVGMAPCGIAHLVGSFQSFAHLSLDLPVICLGLSILKT